MYARVSNGVVLEKITPVAGFSIQQCFTPEIVAALIPCSTEVEAGWSYDAETGAFTAPPAPSAPEAPVEPVAPVEPPAE